MSRSILLVLLTGCVSAFEPSERWIEFDPPAYYQTWHQEVETCLGVQRSFEDIRWRKVYDGAFTCGAMAGAGGCFIRPKTIYLMEKYLDLEWLVKAELIHYVRQNGWHDELFYQCGGK